MVVAYEAVADAPEGLSEIHMFVGAGWLLSVTWTATPLLDAVRDGFATRRSSGPDTTGTLLYALLDAAVDSYFPVPIIAPTRSQSSRRRSRCASARAILVAAMVNCE